MDFLFIGFGLLCLILGIIGNFLPVIPGVIISWVGVLLIYLSPSIPYDSHTVILTLGISLIVFIIDFIIPAMAVKYFGGTKYGMYGASIGLIVSLFFPLPFMINLILGSFLGSLVGELIAKNKMYLRSSIGSVIGLFASTVIKVSVSIIYLVMAVYVLWKYLF